MATGGHHGGGHHTGGHHGGGGGFHGGGGGFHGGHYSNGHYGGGDGLNYLIYRFGMVALFIVFAILYAINKHFHCYNVINSIMMIASIVIFIVAGRKKGEISGIYPLMKSAEPDRCTAAIYSDELAERGNAQTDGSSWYDDEDFCIFLDSRAFKESNMSMAHKELSKWPFILKIRDIFWYLFAGFWFIMNTFFYEKVIPVFEKKVMTDAAFHFVDELVYYLPAILILISGITVGVVTFLRLRFLKKLARKIVEENQSKKIIADETKSIEEIAEEFWYHNECQNCGIEVRHDITRCKSCGSSLRVLNLTLVPEVERHQITSKKRRF